MSLLTVITVVKDDTPGLIRTLDSLSAQDASDSDLLVVDGSSDREEVPAELARRDALRATYTWSAPRGVYPAMNVGLGLADGSYVYFLNAGDVLAAGDVLSRVAKQLASHRPTWAFGSVRFVHEDGVPMPEPPWEYGEELRHSFARGRFPAHQGVVVSSDELRRQGGFDTTYRVAADYASILRCARRAAPLELAFALAEFTAGGLSTQQWRLAQAEFHRARREILEPQGLAAATERAYTWRAAASTAAYRALWAPGRPASGLVRRVRSRVPGMRGRS